MLSKPICVCNWDWEYILKLYNDEIRSICVICTSVDGIYGSGSVRQSPTYIRNIYIRLGVCNLNGRQPQYFVDQTVENEMKKCEGIKLPA